MRFTDKSYAALKKLLDTLKDKVDKLWQVAKQNIIVDFQMCIVCTLVGIRINMWPDFGKPTIYTQMK